MKRLSLPFRFGILFLFPLIGGFFAYWYHDQLLSLIIQSRDSLTIFVKNHHTLSIIYYMLLFILDNIFALPLASLMTIAAGYFYGPLVATIITLTASVCGATLSFLITRHLVGFNLQQVYQERLINFNNWFNRWGGYYLLLVRFIPLIPFAMVNILAGLTTVSLTTFMVTTAFGMVPVTTLFALSGKEFKYISSFSDIFNGKMAVFICIFAILMTIPFLLKKLRLVV